MISPLPAIIGLNVAQGSATSVVEQYIGTGKVDLNQVLTSGIMEGVTAGFMPNGSSSSVNSLTDSLDNNLDTAISATVKNADNNVDTAMGATIDSADNYFDEGADAANTLSKNVDTSPSVPSKSGTSSVEVNPNDIRFSQSSVNNADDITKSMKNNGWQGDPIDVVKMPDGRLTTIENTRVLSARYADINVRANVNAYDDILPASMIERFTTTKGIPSI